MRQRIPLDRVGLKDPSQTPFANVRGPRTLESFFAEHFRDPARVVPGSRMPKQELSEAQVKRLTHYMFSLRRRDLPTGLWPNDRLRIARFGGTGFLRDGEALYGAFCAGCHGADRRAGLPNPNSSRKDFPPLHQLASRYQLSDRDDIQLVVGELRERGALSAERPLDVARWNVTLVQDEMVRTVIAKGNPSGRENFDGPVPIDMPAWEKVLSQRQMTDILTYLLSSSDEDDEDDE